MLSTVKINEVKKWSEVAQSCPTLCDPMDCSPPGSSVHGILQARTLEWVAIFFSRGSSRPSPKWEAEEAIYSELCYSQGVNHHQVHLAESKAGRGVEKMCSQNGEGFRETLREGCWLRKAGGGLTMGYLMWLVWRANVAFSDWSWVEARANMRDVCSHDDQILTVLGQFLQRLWFGFLEWLLWVRYMICPLSACIFHPCNICSVSFKPHHNPMRLLIFLLQLYEWEVELQRSWVTCPKSSS